MDKKILLNKEQLMVLWYTSCYDNRIVPLLRRISNLEELTLFLSVIRNESTYIDGTQLCNDFLIHMSQLRKFNFSIHTDIFNNDIHMLMISSRTIGVVVMSIHFRIISKFFYL
jgi:hypothetical protein